MTGRREQCEPVPVQEVSPGWPARTGYTGVVCTRHAPAETLAALGRAMETWCASLQPVQAARGKEVYRLPAAVPGAAGVYVKRYVMGGAITQLRTVLQIHPAQKAWRIGLRLASHGIPTPEPVALLAKRRGWMVSDLVLVTEEAPNAATVSSYVDRVFGAPAGGTGLAARAHKREVIARLARFVAVLHRAGIYHGDFSAHNLVVDEKTLRLYLLDLDAVRSTRGIGRRRRLKNLDKFGRNFLDLRVCSPWDRARFLREYQREWSGPSFGALAAAERRRRYHALIRSVWQRTQASLRVRGQRFEPAR